MELLITGAWAEGRQHIPELEAMGYRVTFLQQERDPLPADPGRFEAVVCNGLFVCHPMEVFTGLGCLQLTSAGLDRIDLEAVRSRGIALYNARGVYSIPMAEFAICGVLQLYKKTRTFFRSQQDHRWEKCRSIPELWGQRVLILGCGSVGTECAKRFGAFGCRVMGVDLVPREDPAYEMILPMAELDRELGEADILVVTLPLTPETAGLLDARRLACLKPGAVLVNIARGPIVDTAALTAALMPGTPDAAGISGPSRLGGAVLDVFEQEPLPAESPLWDLENVILTPHNSYVGAGNAARLSRLILSNLRIYAERRAALEP